MRWRGVHRVEFSVLDDDASVAFCDRMFGWLGYRSFWSLDLGYRSTHYTARFPLPHSYIGVQPAKSGRKLDHAARATGIHHIALGARPERGRPPAPRMEALGDGRSHSRTAAQVRLTAASDASRGTALP